MEYSSKPSTSTESSTSKASSSGAADSHEETVMSGSTAFGSVFVKLHPLVIMNVSDHWTRVRAQDGKQQKVFGALIGKQSGRTVEVMNSFELLYKTEGGNTVIDTEYFYKKEEQFKQVFKDLDFLGWYTTGGKPTDKDVRTHEQICVIHESPILLLLDSQASTANLPISVYESVIDIEEGNTVTHLVSVDYTLATEEAERIGVDHVARVSNLESGVVSSASEHLHSQHSSITMLHTRIKLILSYVKAVQNKELPYDHETMRSINSFCQHLPVLGQENLTADLHTQYNGVTLLTYLGMMSKGSQTMNQFISKFNVLFDRHTSGRRMRGLFV